MTEIIHLNAGTLRVASYPTVVCHCVAIVERGAVALIDTGIGVHDVRDPERRLGRSLIDAAGFCFNRRDTAAVRLLAMGIEAFQVCDIVLTHADPDHTGGLADFPAARVHVSERELKSVLAGSSRYVASHFEHSPRWQSVSDSSATREWFGLSARVLPLELTTEVLLVPLPGHTLGHCGVAVRNGSRWLLHAGDAYYLRAELDDPHHPVEALAAARAEDDALRRGTLDRLRTLIRDHAARIEVCGYHDIAELPKTCIDWE